MNDLFYVIDPPLGDIWSQHSSFYPHSFTSSFLLRSSSRITLRSLRSKIISCVIMQIQNAWHDVIIVKFTCIGTICQRNISFIVLLILSIWFFPKILVLKLLDRTGRKIVWTKWKRWICSTTFKWIQIKKTVVFAIIQS